MAGRETRGVEKAGGWGGHEQACVRERVTAQACVCRERGGWGGGMWRRVKGKRHTPRGQGYRPTAGGYWPPASGYRPLCRLPTNSTGPLAGSRCRLTTRPLFCLRQHNKLRAAAPRQPSSRIFREQGL